MNLVKMKIELEMSNDAYHYFYGQEEPIDDENIAEIHEILLNYPKGLNVISAKPIPNSNGLVSVTLEENDVTHYIEMFNGWQYQFKYTDKDKVHFMLYNRITGEIKYSQGLDVRINSAGKREVKTPNNSYIPIWRDVKQF